MLKLLFHLFGALQFCYGCYYDHTYVKVPLATSHVTPFGGKLKYLTHLDAVRFFPFFIILKFYIQYILFKSCNVLQMIQTVYFTVALLNDLFGNNEPAPSEKPLIRRIKDIIFSALAFPVALFVGITFWGIYAVDRELILPRSVDPYFPLWLNHVMHTNIVLFILLEAVTSFRMYPTRKKGLSILCTFMLLYVVWFHYIYFQTGSWVYPILNVLNWPLRVVFYLFSLGFVCSLYIIGERLNRAVWSKEVEATVRSGKKKAK